jgi:hypothetical protein
MNYLISALIAAGATILMLLQKVGALKSQASGAEAQGKVDELDVNIANQEKAYETWKSNNAGVYGPNGKSPE